MPTLTQLEYIVAVDENRHFAKAAKACFVSQPTLSMQLQKAEEELDVVIFDRSKQPVIPTNNGKIIIEHAKKIILETKRLKSAIQSRNKEPEGEFRLAIIPTLSSSLLPLFLESFSQKYPKVTLIIDELKTEEIIEALESEKIDAGLLVTPLNQAHIKERVLFYEPFVALLSQSHPLSAKTKLNEQDLKDQKFWLLQEGHCFRNQVLNLCSHRKELSALKNVQFQSGNLETLKNLIKKGSGGTLIPYLNIALDHDPKLKKLMRMFKRPVPNREVSLVYSREHLKQNIISAIEDEILQGLPKELNKTTDTQIEIIEID